jgi:hemerythrin
MDHQLLFGLIEGVVHELEYRDCSVLSQAFELLDGRLRSHFKNEERIAETVKFTFDQHKEAQKFFLKELEYLKDELLCKDGVWCEDAVKHFSDSLRGMMMDHITRKDMLMKPVLRGYPYDLTAAGQDMRPPGLSIWS